MNRTAVVAAAGLSAALGLFYFEESAGIKDMIHAHDGMSIKQVTMRLEQLVIPSVIVGVFINHFQGMVEWLLEMLGIRDRVGDHNHSFTMNDLLVCACAILLSFVVLTFYSMAVLN